MTSVWMGLDGRKVAISIIRTSTVYALMRSSEEARDKGARDNRVLYLYTADPTHMDVGECLLEILERSGWRAVRLQKPPPWAELDFDQGMLMAFQVPEKPRLDNCRRAIEEFLPSAR